MLLFFMWELIMLGLLVAVALWLLAAKGTAWHVYLSMWVSWGMALALVALVPIDLHIVYLKRCIDHYGEDAAAQEAACSVSSWRDIAGPERSAKDVLEKWYNVLRSAWTPLSVRDETCTPPWRAGPTSASSAASNAACTVGKLPRCFSGTIADEMVFIRALAGTRISPGLTWMIGGFMPRFTTS